MNATYWKIVTMRNFIDNNVNNFVKSFSFSSDNMIFGSMEQLCAYCKSELNFGGQLWVCIIVPKKYKLKNQTIAVVNLEETTKANRIKFTMFGNPVTFQI